MKNILREKDPLFFGIFWLNSQNREGDKVLNRDVTSEHHRPWLSGSSATKHKSKIVVAFWH